jgi:NAD-dependent DNA ligase
MHYIGPKYDGQAGLIHYRDGIPIAAYTRGDGSEGSNVFAKAVFINGVGLPNIPRFGLQGDVYVGGEFIISQTTFAALKKIPRDDKGREYKTARNLMGGILRRKTVDRKLLGKIDFIAFKIESDTTAWVPGSKTVKPISEFNKEDKVRFLKQLGFITDLSLGQEHALSPLISHGAKKSYVSELLKRWRDACPYDTDGLVVEINDYKKAVKYGAGTLEATHAKAIKPDLKDHQIAETTINKLVFRCTHRGIYPAKIKIEPVEIGGVTIKSITGKNHRGDTRANSRPALVPFCIDHRIIIRNRSRAFPGGEEAVIAALRDGTLPPPTPLAERSKKGGTTKRKAAKPPAKAPRSAKAPRVVDTGEKIPRGAPVDGLALVRRMAGVIARLGGIDAAEALADELAAMGGAQ